MLRRRHRQIVLSSNLYIPANLRNADKGRLAAQCLVKTFIVASELLSL